MFKFLKEKIVSWAKKISREKSEEPEKEEKPKEHKKITVKPKRESFLQKITSKLSKIKISEKEFEVYGEDLRALLLGNNVAYEVTERIINELKKRIVGRELLKKR